MLAATYEFESEGRPMSLDLDALETSFDLVAPRGDELMDEFYARWPARTGGPSTSAPGARRATSWREPCSRAGGWRRSARRSWFCAAGALRRPRGRREGRA